ncbi:hypothetical protein [Devosia sediminis]|uniref:Uncharacterized protein n=1 Tax=Devosia sediminis TaxID=2798801 RepID=A0A934MSF3_9HYPH|nr:hypothetical protein [Devosia sediminis]MBJ3786394.1 hypothetical protein [Devosia sediminis]
MTELASPPIDPSNPLVRALIKAIAAQVAARRFDREDAEKVSETAVIEFALTKDSARNGKVS